MNNQKSLITFAIFLFSILLSILSLNIVSGWPYELNISTGILVDLNSSNNATTNFTIYVIPANYTFVNYTTINYTFVNYTSLNTTCFNCTYIFNDTYVIVNGTLFNSTEIYNKSESDSKFLTIVNFNSYKDTLTYPYVTTADFNTAITNLNNSIQTAPEIPSNASLWVVVIISIFLSLVAVGLALRNSQ